MRRWLIPLAALLLLTAAISACGGDDNAASITPTPAPVSVTFMAGFKPQADLPFVGAYVAKDKGFFAAEGLDVDIQHVTTPGDNFPLLASGRVQFSTADASEVLNHRAGDPSLPLVSVALIGQTGQQGFAVLVNSGIQTPTDWVGKTAGYKGDTVPPDYLRDRRGGSPRPHLHHRGPHTATTHRCSRPSRSTSPGVSVERAGHAEPPGLPHEARHRGRLRRATRCGLTYVATQDYVQQNPAIVGRFVKAALQGIAYADQHRDEAIDIVLKHAPEEDRAHQRYMLDTELDHGQDRARPNSAVSATRRKSSGRRSTITWCSTALFPTPCPTSRVSSRTSSCLRQALRRERAQAVISRFAPVRD